MKYSIRKKKRIRNTLKRKYRKRQRGGGNNTHAAPAEEDVDNKNSAAPAKEDVDTEKPADLKKSVDSEESFKDGAPIAISPSGTGNDSSSNPKNTNTKNDAKIDAEEEAKNKMDAELINQITPLKKNIENQVQQLTSLINQLTNKSLITTIPNGKSPDCNTTIAKSTEDIRTACTSVKTGGSKKRKKTRKLKKRQKCKKTQKRKKQRR